MMQLDTSKVTTEMPNENIFPYCKRAVISIDRAERGAAADSAYKHVGYRFYSVSEKSRNPAPAYSSTDY